jgi:preprotein translocase subunit YajC
MKSYKTNVVVLCAIFVFGCSSLQQPQTKSPTEVMQALNEASKAKDVAGIKNSVSKGTLALIEESAKAQNITVDEALKKDSGAPFKDLPEMRNEKIEGDTATIELKNATTNDWETIPFVKEDGVWRLALDKYLEDFKKKATEDMKMPPPDEDKTESNASPSGADKKPKETEKKPANSKK